MGACKSKPPAEAHIQQEIRLALGLEPGLCLWRNNIGASVFAGTSRPVHFGVGGKGGSDLIGMLAMEVVLDGRPLRIARFVALEIKRPGGRVTAEQRGFIECVRNNGGFAAIVHDVAEAKAAIERCRLGEAG